MLGGMELGKLGRYEFYDACCRPAVRLAISTGEQRVFANILFDGRGGLSRISPVTGQILHTKRQTGQPVSGCPVSLNQKSSRS